MGLRDYYIVYFVVSYLINLVLIKAKVSHKKHDKIFIYNPFKVDESTADMKEELKQIDRTIKDLEEVKENCFYINLKVY